MVTSSVMLPDDRQVGPQAVNVDLWRWRLDGSDDGAGRDAELLAPDEMARARRLATPRLASCFVAARGGLRRRLAPYVKRAPDHLVFDYGANGKPSLAATDAVVPFFNLSHSGEEAALAVSWQTAVGVDMEEVRVIAEDVASFFSPREQSALAALAGPTARRAFFRCWTRKEAVLKAMGSGLAVALDRFDVSVGEEPMLLAMDDEPMAAIEWRLHGFEPRPDLIGTLAVRCGPAPLRVTDRT